MHESSQEPNIQTTQSFTTHQPGPDAVPHGDNLNSNQENENEDVSEGPTSSLANVVPLEKLKKGWFAVSGLVFETAQKVQEKAVEAYNSESFQNIKQKTTEVVTPAWEKTCEVATPVWEQTKQGATVAFEKTKEGVQIATEKMKPTIETVSTQVGTAASTGWKVVSEVASTAAEYTTEQVTKISHSFQGGEEQYPASAMDSASRGGPMKV